MDVQRQRKTSEQLSVIEAGICGLNLEYADSLFTRRQKCFIHSLFPNRDHREPIFHCMNRLIVVKPGLRTTRTSHRTIIELKT